MASLLARVDRTAAALQRLGLVPATS